MGLGVLQSQVSPTCELQVFSINLVSLETSMVSFVYLSQELVDIYTLDFFLVRCNNLTTRVLDYFHYVSK